MVGWTDPLEESSATTVGRGLPPKCPPEAVPVSGFNEIVSTSAGPHCSPLQRICEWRPPSPSQGVGSTTSGHQEQSRPDDRPSLAAANTSFCPAALSPTTKLAFPVVYQSNFIL